MRLRSPYWVVIYITFHNEFVAPNENIYFIIFVYISYINGIHSRNPHLMAIRNLSLKLLPKLDDIMDLDSISSKVLT